MKKFHFFWIKSNFKRQTLSADKDLRNLFTHDAHFSRHNRFSLRSHQNAERKTHLCARRFGDYKPLIRSTHAKKKHQFDEPPNNLRPRLHHKPHFFCFLGGQPEHNSAKPPSSASRHSTYLPLLLRRTFEEWTSHMSSSPFKSTDEVFLAIFLVLFFLNKTKKRGPSLGVNKTERRNPAFVPPDKSSPLHCKRCGDVTAGCGQSERSFY